MNALARIKDAGFEVWLKDNGNIGVRPFDALTAEQLAYIKAHKAKIVEALAANDAKPELNADDAFFTDDRQNCRECRHLSSSGFCIQQRFRPVDDIPRRCDDFNGYPASTTTTTKPKPKPTAPAPVADPLIVTVYTPSGTPMTIRADDAEHAAWLRKMNPKPTNPAPKPPVPEPDAERITEAEHNAAGRYFKFLATWPDGSQCYLCQMPRMTLAEMLAQYPTAITMQPIENEEYP